MKNRLSYTIIIVLFSLFAPATLAAGQSSDTNVNSRYTVENVELNGVSESRISKKLREDMQKLVGEKFDQDAADQLAKRIRRELPEYRVHTKVRRGDTPDHVKVVFEAARVWWKKFDIERSRLVYESKEGWSGGLITSFDTHHNVFTIGGVNSADELLERYAGFVFGYEHQKVGTDRLRFRMGFETFHEKWNPATEFSLQTTPDVPGIYRERQNFAPAVAVMPFRGFELSAGTSFQRLQIQFPGVHTENAYAGTLGAAYRHSFEGSNSLQRVNVEYSLRSATHILDSDFVYTRHALEARYTATLGRNYFGLRFLAGGITGLAPLFERFSLGNATTLRGWNKFDVAPLGGSRMAYASFEYRYSGWQVFYDGGNVWEPGQTIRFKHSVGFGWADRHGTFVSLGVPLRLHDVTPIVMFGMRF